MLSGLYILGLWHPVLALEIIFGLNKIVAFLPIQYGRDFEIFI